MKPEPSTPAVRTADHLRLAIDAAGVALWPWNVDTTPSPWMRAGMASGTCP